MKKFISDESASALKEAIEDVCVHIGGRRYLHKENRQCPLCKSDTRIPKMHYIVPIEFGGKDETENKVWICDECENTMNDIRYESILYDTGEKYFETYERMWKAGNDYGCQIIYLIQNIFMIGNGRGLRVDRRRFARWCGRLFDESEQRTADSEDD